MKALSWRLSARFRSDRRGATALEFALVAPIFLALMFGTIDIGWVMMRTMLLDRALDKAVRLVRVGAKGAPTSAAAFKTAVCRETVMAGNCNSDLMVEMTTVSTAADLPSSDVACVSRGGAPINPRYSSGARGDLVVVRACLSVSPLVSVTGAALSIPRQADGSFHIITTNIFVSEPGQ